METVSLVASIVSVIIGAFAIWLSVTFYRMSNKISEDTREASKGISASVDRLESLFDRLYSDTFSMMKDTVSDMRKHIWPEKEQPSEKLNEIEEKADEKIKQLRDEIGSEMSSVMSQMGRTAGKIDGVETRLTELIDKAIQTSRRVESEAQEEMSMSEVLSRVYSFVKRYGETSVGRIITHPIMRKRFPKSMVMEALAILIRDKMIEADGEIDDLGLNTVVKVRRSNVPLPDPEND